MTLENPSAKKKSKGRRRKKKPLTPVQVQCPEDLEFISRRLEAGDDAEMLAPQLLSRGYSRLEAARLATHFDDAYQRQLRRVHTAKSQRDDGDTDTELGSNVRGTIIGLILSVLLALFEYFRD